MESIISVVLTVLGLIIIVFGWFIVKIFGNVSDNIIKLNDQILKLSGLISGMNAIQMAAQENVAEIKTSCTSRRGEIYKRLDEHGERINKHETEIQVLKSKK